MTLPGGYDADSAVDLDSVADDVCEEEDEEQSGEEEVMANRFIELPPEVCIKPGVETAAKKLRRDFVSNQKPFPRLGKFKRTHTPHPPFYLISKSYPLASQPSGL